MKTIIRTLAISVMGIIISGIFDYTHAQGTYSSILGGTIANTIPLNTSATSSNRRMWVFHPSDFPTAPSGLIDKIYIKVSGTPSSTFTNFTVKMGYTTLSVFTAGPFITTGMDTAFFSPAFTVSAITGGWLPITLQNPFFYDGTSNFIVDIAHYGYTTGMSILQADVPGRSLFGNAGAATANIQHRLVDFGFDLILGGDAGIASLSGINDTICAGTQSVVAELKNFGTSPLSSVTINWQVNSVSQPPINWTGSLAPNASTNVVLGSYNFLVGANYSIMAATTNPNGVADSDTSNDTLEMTNILVLPELLGTIIPSATVDFCDGDSMKITLISPTANTFQWFFNETQVSGAVDSILYLKQAGKYYALFSDGVCSRVSDTITAVTHQSPFATITSYTPTTFCHGDSVWLFANTGTGLTYEWRRDGISIPGAIASTYLAKENGIYTVTTTNVGNCSTTSDTLGVNVKPIHPIDLGPDLVVCEDITVVLDAGAGADTYLWSNGLATQTISIDTAIAGLGAKTYSVTATLNGCESRDEVVVDFIICSGINDIKNKTGFEIHPNPAVNAITIRLNNNSADEFVVTLTDISGRVIYSDIWMPGGTMAHKEIKVSDLPKGVYLLKLDSKQKIFTERVIIR